MRTRSDYRKEPEGTIRHYLLFCYPQGLDFQRSIRHAPQQLHDTKRDQGRYVNLSNGNPDLSQHFLNQLAGIPRSVFTEAIDAIRAKSDRGRMMIEALEFYQGDGQRMRRFGISPQDVAREKGTSPRNLLKLRDQAIEEVEDYVRRHLLESKRDGGNRLTGTADEPEAS